MAYPCSGRNAKIVYNSGIVASMHEWTLDVAVDLLDCNAFGNTWKAFISGMGGATGTLRGYFNPDDTYQYALHANVLTADPGAAVTLKLYMDTNDYIQVSAILGGLRIGVSQTGVETVEIPFTVSGAPAMTKA